MLISGFRSGGDFAEQPAVFIQAGSSKIQGFFRNF